MSGVGPLAPAVYAFSMSDTWLHLNASNWNATRMEGGGIDLTYREFQYQQLVANNIAVAAVTLYGWEFVTTLSGELQLYQRAYRKSVSYLPVILFALVRYGSIPAVILPAYSVWHDFRGSKHGCLVHQQLCIVFVQLIVSCVFVWRTAAIWRKERKVVLFMLAITTVQFALSFYFLWYSTEMLLPNGACMPMPVRGSYNTLPWFYLLAFLYDSALAFMSIFKLWSYTDDATTPLAQRRRYNGSEAPAASAIVVVPRENGAGNDATESEKSHSPASFRRPSLPSHRPIAEALNRFAGEKVRSARRRYSSLPPLLIRLLGNGLQYFLMASIFNVASLGLEASRNIHAKSIIALYAPVMAMTCQRLILLEVKAVWGPFGSADPGFHNDSLVDRVIRPAGESWQGVDDDAVRYVHLTDLKSSRRRGSVPASPSPTPPPRMSPHSPSRPRPKTANAVSHTCNDGASSASETSGHNVADSNRNIAAVKMPEEQRGLALRMAGL